MPTLDDLLSQLPETKLRLCNLFQRQDRTWQANVCEDSTSDGYQFGFGATPVDALIAALKVTGVIFEEP